MQHEQFCRLRDLILEATDHLEHTYRVMVIVFPPCERPRTGEAETKIPTCSRKMINFDVDHLLYIYLVLTFDVFISLMPVDQTQFMNSRATSWQGMLQAQSELLSRT